MLIEEECQQILDDIKNWNLGRKNLSAIFEGVLDHEIYEDTCLMGK